jgi:hypothetical protein
MCLLSVHCVLIAVGCSVPPLQYNDQKCLRIDTHAIVYASAVSSGHDEGVVVKITIMVKHLLDVELDLVKVCQTVGGQKSTIIYIVIKADFWPPLPMQ